MIHPRIAIAALTLSASALVGIAAHEGYVEVAVPPVKGDVPTNGFGTTGGVKLGDRTDPVRAIIRLQQDADEYARAIKQCAPVPMHQHEFDAWVRFTYNVGPSAFCQSTARRKLLLLDYAGACAEMKRWVRFKGRVLPGLVKRRAAEYKLCMGHEAR